MNIMHIRYATENKSTTELRLLNHDIISVCILLSFFKQLPLVLYFPEILGKIYHILLFRLVILVH